MKNTLVIALICLVFTCSAQFNKGDKFITGRLSFQSSDTHGWFSSPQSETSIDDKRYAFVPEVGFLLGSNFSLTGQLGYLGSKKFESSVASNYTDEEISREIIIGTSSRRYFVLGERFLLALNGELQFARGSFSEKIVYIGDENEFGYRYYKIIASVRPSFIFFISSNWAFETSVGFLRNEFYRNLSAGGYKSNKFSIDILNIGLGLSYFIRKTASGK